MLFAFSHFSQLQSFMTQYFKIEFLPSNINLGKMCMMHDEDDLYMTLDYFLNLKLLDLIYCFRKSW